MIQDTRKLKLIAASILAGLAAIAIYLWIFANSAYTDNAYLHGDVTIIKPKVSGYIIEVLIKDNQPVQKGQILAKIDNREYLLKIKQTQDEMEATSAKIDNLKQSLTIQGYEIQKSTYELDSAKVAFEKAKKDYSRAQVLVKDRAVSVQSFDNSYEIFKSAESKFSTKKAEVEMAKLQEAAIKSSLNEEQANLKKLQASLGLAELDLEYTNIIAQTDGKISRQALQLGQLVTSNTAIAFIVQNDVWLVANFKETQVGKMKRGQKAIVTVDALGDKKFKAKVDSLAPATGAEFSILPPENATGNFTKIVQRVPVKIVFDQSQDLSKLKPGLSSEVTVELK